MLETRVTKVELEYLPVRWGVAYPGHCAFSNEEVEMPRHGENYI